MRKTLTTAALLLALGCPALAGEMHTPPAPQPQVLIVEEPTLNGEMGTPGLSESLMQTVLEMLAVLPTIL